MSFSISASEAGGNAFTTYGDIGQVALPVAALLMTAVKGDKQGALQFAESFAASEAATYGLKYAINERRPDGGTHAFPSGHTSAAFAGASFIQQRYGWDWGIPAYVAAAGVGISRVTAHKHYIHDVIAGAGIGIGANLIFTKKYQKDTLAIGPMPVDGGAGLMLTYHFQ